MTYDVIVPYADEAFATAYFGDRLGTEAYDLANSATRVKALKQATLQIDQLPLIGTKYDETQVREFPRSVDEDGTIDDAVKMACCEVAIALLEGKTPSKLDKSVGRSSEQVGDVSVTYDGSRGKAGAFDDFDGLPSRLAAQLLAPWIAETLEIDLTRV